MMLLGRTVGDAEAKEPASDRTLVGPPEARDLPEDVIRFILCRLYVTDSLSVALTCKRWYHIQRSSVAALRPRLAMVPQIAASFPGLRSLDLSSAGAVPAASAYSDEWPSSSLEPLSSLTQLTSFRCAFNGSSGAHPPSLDSAGPSSEQNALRLPVNYDMSAAVPGLEAPELAGPHASRSGSHGADATGPSSESPWWPRCREAQLRWDIQLVHARWLRALPRLTALQSLDLSGQPQAMTIFETAHSTDRAAFLRQLRSLTLARLLIRSHASMLSAASALAHATSLTALDISSWSVSTSAIPTPPRGPPAIQPLPALRELALGTCVNDGVSLSQYLSSFATPVAVICALAGVNEALADGALPSVSFLDLSHRPVAWASLPRLFPAVTRLKLTGCRDVPGPAPARIPAALMALSDLRDLDISNLEALSSDGPFFHDLTLPRLTRLDVSHASDLWRQRTEFVSFLTEHRAPMLRELDLSHTRLADALSVLHVHITLTHELKAFLERSSMAAEGSSDAECAAAQPHALAAALPLERFACRGANSALFVLALAASRGLLPRLKHLDLSKCTMLPGFVLSLLQRCTALETLDISESIRAISVPQDTAVMAAIVDLTRLTRLSVAGSGTARASAATEALAAVLPRMPALRALAAPNMLRFPKLSRAVTAALAAQSALLESLDLSSAQFSSDCVAAIGTLRSLRRLNLSKSSLTSATLPHLTRLTLLEALTLSGTDLDDDAGPSLAALSALTSLVLDHTAVSDGVLGHMPALPRLRELSIAQRWPRRAAARGPPDMGPEDQPMSPSTCSEASGFLSPRSVDGVEGPKSYVTASGLACLAFCQRLASVHVSSDLAAEYADAVGRGDDTVAQLPGWMRLFEAD